MFMFFGVRAICFLCVCFVALDEPSNAISIPFFSWVGGQHPLKSVPEAARPLRGLDDVTDLARTLPPPSPPAPDGRPELLESTTTPITSTAKHWVYVPEYVPLLC